MWQCSRLSTLGGVCAVSVLVAGLSGFAPPDERETKPTPGMRSTTPPAESESKAPVKAESKAEFKGDPYTLDTCIVSGEKLGAPGNGMGDPVVKEYDGREVRFCCKNCVPKFEADKEKYLKKIDEKLVEQQLPHYPLKTCVVMPADPLAKSEHGDPVNYIYRNRLVRFCCKGCIPDFNDDPAKFIAKLNEAVIAQQADHYPLATCPISGEKLGSAGSEMGEPVNHVVGVTLIRFCCKDCVKPFNKNPQAALAKVHEAWKAEHEKGAEHGDEDDHDHGGHGHDHEHGG